jgi:type II secretory pathway component PulF
MSYQPPRSNVTSPQSPSFHPLRLAIGLIAPLLVGLVALVVVPQFNAVFVSFGADLPAMTQWLIDYPWALCLTPLPVLALWAAWPGPQRDRTACVFGVVLAMAAVAYLVIALYQPIFRLGATI